MNVDEQKQIASEPSTEQTLSPSFTKNVKDVKSAEEKPKINAKIRDFDSDGISLNEDDFAQYYDENGTQHSIKRFTWKNKNKIQVQVLNYGARVISIKLPDRKGEVEDILLGFDDLAGYLFYDKFYFGSVIGRICNVIKNSTFSVGNKKITLNSNHGKHSMHGGEKGLDKVVWDTYITGKKVIMSHISPHLSEGYPGDLLVRVIFELSAKNEFKVSFNAQTTKPTCIDLSHLLYFNLAGHYTGPDEIYRHMLTLNCNCFTPQVNQIPTGEILNVLHTQYDFQVPKILGKVMGIVPKDGFNQNLCVNRGMYQNECFVGRLLHPPSGRMLEVYSNQPGVQLNTANDFGCGNILSMEEIVQSQSKIKTDKSIPEKVNKTMVLFTKVHEKLVDILKLDREQNFNEIRQLIYKFSCLRNNFNESASKIAEESFNVTPMQNDYLKKAREIVCENEETDDECLDLKDVLSAVLKIVQVLEPPSAQSSQPPSGIELLHPTSASKRTSLTLPETVESSQAGVLQPVEKVASKIPEPLKMTSPIQSKSTNEKVNTIPVYYKNSQEIRGKERALYKTHGAISLQTQNYPNAVNVKHFPNTTLNPGEVYSHEIVYRFWIRAGNPNKWIKRNLNESKLRTNKN